MNQTDEEYDRDYGLFCQVCHRLRIDCECPDEITEEDWAENSQEIG